MWRLGVLILFSISLTPSLALAQWQPDLMVRAVHLNPADPEPDDRVQIMAIIANEGRGDVCQSFDVRFRLDNLTISRKRVMRLGAGRTVEVQAQWRAVAGEHRLLVEVDRPFGRVEESNERNNSLEIKVTVRRKAAIYSITAEVMQTIGEGLQTSGEMFHFTVRSDISAAIDQGVKQLERAQLILDSAGSKLVQIGESLPSPLSQDPAITGGRAIGEIFQRMADSLSEAAPALRSFNVNAAVTALRELEAELNDLSQLDFAGVGLKSLALAADHLEDAAQAALALQTSLFGSGSGKGGESTDELIADFQEALGRAGDLIGAVGTQLMGLQTTRGISFTEEVQGQQPLAHHAGNPLLIQVYGAVSLVLEVYDPGGRLVARRVVIDDRLCWQGEDNTGSPLPAGEYLYRLRADRGAGEETDIGRILIS